MYTVFIKNYQKVYDVPTSLRSEQEYNGPLKFNNVANDFYLLMFSSEKKSYNPYVFLYLNYLYTVDTTLANENNSYCYLEYS